MYIVYGGTCVFIYIECMFCKKINYYSDKFNTIYIEFKKETNLVSFTFMVY